MMARPGGRRRRQPGRCEAAPARCGGPVLAVCLSSGCWIGSFGAVGHEESLQEATRGQLIVWAPWHPFPIVCLDGCGWALRRFEPTAGLISCRHGGTESIVKTMSKPSPQIAEESLAAERRAFEHQRARLMRRFPGEYVALSGGRVVDHDKQDEALAARMFTRFGEATFYIARLEQSPTVYEVPSPEFIS